MDRKRAPPEASNGSTSSLHQEKMDILDRVQQETKLRDEKRALIAAMGGDAATEVWTPTVENPRLQRKLLAESPYREVRFEVEPEYRDEPPPSRDEFPHPLSHVEDFDYHQEQSSRPRLHWRCVGVSVILVCMMILAGVIFFTRGGRAMPSSATGMQDGATAPPVLCSLNFQRLSKCKIYGLDIPDCAKEQFNALRPIYLTHVDPMDFDVLSECDVTHKAVLALAVARSNFQLDDDAGFYYAMAAIYFALGGEQWRNKENWLQTASPCDWFGTNCKASLGHLEVSLQANNMRGTLPTEIGLLSNLRSFHLGKNMIEGSIPSEIGLLYNLEELEIFGNSLQGTLPSEIRKCSNLRHLDLTDTAMTGSLPTELGKCQKLENLTMAGTLITGTLPTEFGSLTNLRRLELITFHRVTGTLPTELFSMEQLRILHVDGPVLEKSPFPSLIGSMTSLESLTLLNIDLTGTIPTEIGFLHQELKSLTLRFNEMESKLPSELGLLSMLVNLDISHSDLYGSIPTQLGLLMELTSINFFSNHLSGTMPSEMGALSLLTALHVDSNKLSGTLPLEICELHIPVLSYDACKHGSSQSNQGSSFCLTDDQCQ